MAPEIVTMSDGQMKQLEQRLILSIQIAVAATMKEEMKLLRDELELSKKEVKNLESNNIDLTKQVNELQQYMRRENVLITNYPEEANENVENIVCKLGEKLGVPINFKVDIQAAHRNPSNSAIKPIIVRFTNRQVRNNFIRASKSKKIKLNNKPVYVNDHLTPANSTLFYKSRKLVHDKKIKAAWTSAGKIFVKRSESSEKIRIQHISDLKPFQIPYASIVQGS